jgi:hypothetical protein
MSQFRICVILFVLAGLFTGCSGGAVVFAPTPPPPDVSPLRYDHPSGAFSVEVPRNWPVYAQNTTTLASASFAPPGSSQPPVRFSVINLGKKLDSAGLADALNQYQKQVRPDARRYTETARQAMGDGSWRLSGLRQTATGETEPVNTFIQQSGTLVGLAEVVIPPDAPQMAELQGIVNSFTLHEDTPLEPTDLSALGSAGDAGLDIVHVSTWTTDGGVFFITGEVANYGPSVVTDVPVRAGLYTADGLGMAEAVDNTMSYGIPPGGFAPFSLRFGARPAQTARYQLSLGGADWKPEASRVVLGQDQLDWTDDSQVGEDGKLVITGTVRNKSDQPARDVRAVVTLFDAAQNVVAAGFSEVTPLLDAKASAPYQIVVPERGGDAVNYIVSVEALP